jgi:hypothetical protein
MPKFVFAYRGGSMAETEEAQKAVMDQWIGWFGTLGASVLDGGNPFGASKTVGSDGSTSDGGAAELGGYSIIDATNLNDAASKAKGCPVLASGGTVDVYEALDM